MAENYFFGYVKKMQGIKMIIATNTQMNTISIHLCICGN